MLLVTAIIIIVISISITIIIIIAAIIILRVTRRTHRPTDIEMSPIQSSTPASSPNTTLQDTTADTIIMDTPSSMASSTSTFRRSPIITRSVSRGRRLSFLLTYCVFYDLQYLNPLKGLSCEKLSKGIF